MNKSNNDKLFDEVMRHYTMAREDLDSRLTYFNTADELFRSYIDKDNWPYSAVMFVPKVFTTIFEKTARLIGQKPRGRLIPREGGDVLGAKINQEIIDFQWDDATRVDGVPLIAKWAMMDMNARKYGAAFALCKWHYQTMPTKKGKEYARKVYFDGPTLQVLNNRDVLANPSYSSIKNWFQYREYLTYEELSSVNDAAREQPIYKNMEELYDKIRKETKVMDTRETNYTIKNKTLKGYSDYLGRDPFNKTIEVVTEYQNNRWITFAPKHGLILRDIDNPYDHQQIPVIQLKYYALDDDLYGVPEWESIEKLQKGINALTSQYIDAVNIELHSPIGVDSTRVRMHTLEFGPGKKWIVAGDPRSAISKFDFGSPAAIGSYKTVYSVLNGELKEAVGETSAMTSNVNPFGQDKTATEIKDTAEQRLSRDNFNQIFLSEAIKQQVAFWLSMNKQFLFDAGEKSKIIRITGRDSIQYFQNAGLDAYGLSEEATQQLGDLEDANAMEGVNPQEFEQPITPVETDKGIVPKMTVTPQNDFAELHVTPEDLQGNYDYIVDINSMQNDAAQQEMMMKGLIVKDAKDPNTVALLQQEGKRMKYSELLEDYYESLGFKDAGKYFESVPQANEIINQGGGIAPQTGPINQGINPAGGMAAPQAVPGGQNPPLMA